MICSSNVITILIMSNLCLILLLCLATLTGATIENRSIYSPSFDCYLNILSNDDTNNYISLGNHHCLDNLNVSGECISGISLVCSPLKQYLNLIQRNNTIYDIINPWEVVGVDIYLVKNNYDGFYFKMGSNILYPYPRSRSLLCRYKRRIETFSQCYFQELETSMYIWGYNGIPDCDERCSFVIQY
jgi:hypothetical protein